MSLIDDAKSVAASPLGTELWIGLCEEQLAALKALWLSRAQKPVEWYVPSSTLTYIEESKDE